MWLTICTFNHLIIIKCPQLKELGQLFCRPIDWTTQYRREKCHIAKISEQIFRWFNLSLINIYTIAQSREGIKTNTHWKYDF